METTTTSNKEQTKESPDGLQLGQTAASLVSFYGAAPVAQRTSASQAAVATTGATTTTPAGFTTLTQANAIVTLVNEMRAALVASGFIKGS